MRRKSTLSVELLEDRCVPATWGNPWPDATHLTLSFAPDGTRFGSQSSSLFQTLDAEMPRAVWQRAMLRAFQAWAAQANVNLGVVADGGQAFGAAGPVQGDARFGDVRIGAMPLSPDALAASFPFDVTAGTWAGDVRVNSAVNFGAGGYDLYTVLLQEAGHVFGLGNSSDPASVMYENYLGPRTGPSSADAAALQRLYGARTPDRFEGAGGNDTLGTATRLGLLTNADGSLAVSATADVTTAQDRDVYSFTTPLSAGNLLINLKTSGVSLLTAKVSVYDAWGRPVQSAAAVDPLGGDLTLNLGGLNLLSTYYVKVEAAGTGFDVGGYQLQIRYLPLVNGLLGAVTGAAGAVVDGATQLLANNDLHTNDSYNAVGVGLQQSLARTASPLDYAFRASVGDRSDLDFYKVTAPAGGASTLSVMAWGAPTPGQPGGLLTPRVSVYDQAGNLVPAEVLVNDGYTFTAQVPNASPGASYYVSIQAADPSGTHAVGNYFLGVDFTAQPVVLQTAAQGTLAAGARQEGTLTADMSGVFHLVLSAEGPAGDAVRMVVYDDSGQAVFGLQAAAGGTVSGNVYLRKGTYRVVFVSLTPSADPSPLRYFLKFGRMSDNNGPETVDTTGDPSNSSGSGSSSGTTSGSSGDSGLPPQDPSSDPYVAGDSWYYWDGSTWNDPSPSGTASA